MTKLNEFSMTKLNEFSMTKLRVSFRTCFGISKHTNANKPIAFALRPFTENCF